MDVEETAATDHGRLVKWIMAEAARLSRLEVAQCIFPI